MIIGVIGTLGAGKGTAASYISKKKKYKHISMSMIIRYEAKKLGYGMDRTSLQKVGNIFSKRKKGLSEKVLERMAKYKVKDAVVEGIRIVPDIKRLKKAGRFVLVAVDAPIKMRYGRIQKRNNVQDRGVNFLDFKREDEKELKGDWPGQQTGKCLKFADYKIINNRTKKELYKKIDKILAKL